MAPSPATTQDTSGFYSQNSQNGQEGGLNEIQDNLYLEQYKPSLKPIVEPVNYSNEYLASQNNLINQLYQNANQGVQQQMSMNNPYDLGDIRPYAQIDNQQLAPVPTQQQGLDYGALINQFNAAMDADRKQNQINSLVNEYVNNQEEIVENLKKFPTNSVGGFWHMESQPYQMWLDGLYMAGPIAAEYASHFDKKEYLDKSLSKALEDIMQGRSLYKYGVKENDGRI